MNGHKTLVWRPKHHVYMQFRSHAHIKAEAYLGPYQTSIMGFFAKVVNGL